MRKILVLDDKNNLQEIDAGVAHYSELEDSPISISTLNTKVSVVDNKVTVTPEANHRWSEDELNMFCGVEVDSTSDSYGSFNYDIQVKDGRYDILTERFGNEMLLIDTANIDGTLARRCRRITAQYDWIYENKQWLNISDDSAGSLIFTIKPLKENVTKGTNVVLEYSYYSAAGRIGTIQLFVNDTLKTTFSRNSSTTPYTIDITKFLNVGVNNILLVAKSGEQTKEVPTMVNVIDLVLKSSFNDKRLFQGSSVDYSFDLTGSVEKEVYFQFDTEQPIKEKFGSSNVLGRIQKLDISGLSHGTHELKVWAKAYAGSESIDTPVNTYTLPIWKDDNKGTILVLNEAPEEVEQGSTISIKYSPYHANKTAVNITQSFPEEFESNDITVSAAVGVERDWQLVAKEIGNFNFTIASDGSTLTVPVNIIVGAQIDYDQNGLLYSLELVGRENISSDRDVIKYNTINVDPSKVHEAYAKVEDFNFVTDGWLSNKDEEGGRMKLRVNATSMVTYEGMDLLTLLSNPTYSGCSFEVDFRSRNTTNLNRKLITLNTSSNQGITIGEQKVTVRIANSTYEVEYKAEERIRVTVTIGSNVDGNRRIMIYINGVLSFVSRYTSASFTGYTSNLIINPLAGFVDVYGIRMYGSELAMSQVLNNYIASYNSSAERTAARDWNAIYAADGSVSYDNVKKLMPTFVFSTNSKDGANNMPPKKDEKRYGSADYVDPVYKKDFSEEYVGDSKKPVADVQGTSSQKYPRKNFKIKTNSKHSINDAVVGEKVFTFKKDYMDSSHANNTGLAKLVQTLYFTPVPPQISYIQWTDGNEKYTAYDKEGRRIDYQYIYDFALNKNEPFSSLDAIKIEPQLLSEDGKYYFAYMTESGTTYTMCEIETGEKVPTNVSILDKSYIRTTVYGQPCAFFHKPKGGDQAGQYIYQGIYNFNTDKVSTNNMELESEGCLSFEFANNVTNGVLFRSCENFTEIRNSFEYRAYEKDGKSLGLWEDYYDNTDDGVIALEEWINGGYDEKEEEEIPVLNALYNESGTQLYTKFNEELTPINYVFLTNKTAEFSQFRGKEPQTLEAAYRVENGNIQASYVASTASSDDIELAKTIENELGGDSYYEQRGTTKSPVVGEGSAIGCQIINQDTDYIVQWGYEMGGEINEWFNLCYVSDLLTTIPEELQDKVSQENVSVGIKSGSTYKIMWSYTYPVERIWETIAEAGNIFDSEGNVVAPNSLVKYDLFEEMYQPVMDVVNWVIDCYNSYTTTNSTAKFTSEFEQHLNKEYVITYYVMALFAGAADSLAKNMFWNSYDGGQIWYPVWYDIDTCFGLSNDGHPNFPYSLEIYGEGSKNGSADIYNGAKSNFWKLVYAAYNVEIKNKYNELRKQRLTYESVMDILYGQQIALIAPAHYNEDAKFSYLNWDAYFYTAQGSRYERLKYWVESRFNYLDSKMDNTAYEDDFFNLRANATLPISVTTDITMFPGIKFGQHTTTINKKRCEAGNTVVFNPRDYGIDSMNDLETAIHGASHITSLGDLSDHQVQSITCSGKSVLQNIVLGSEEVGYRNNNLKELTVGSNSVIEVINVSNCVNLGAERSVLDLSECHSIRTVLAKNTKLTNITLPEGSPIRQLHLPTVYEINLVNQILLSDLTLDSYEQITKVVWDNVPKSTLTIEEILNNIHKLDDNTKLSEVRIIGYENKEAVTLDWMDWLMSKNGINDLGDAVSGIPYITGTLTVQSLGKEELMPYVEQFNNKISNFAYVSTYDKETEQYSYFKCEEGNYVEISEDELKQYKLNIKLEQLVADKHIFGVSGEGR